MKKFSRRLTGFSLAAAIIFALVHWALSIVALPADAVQFAHLHDMTWNSDTNAMTRTGGDPYAVVEVPPAATPIRAVTFVFAGAYVEPEGTFYIFQSPGADVIPGTVARTSDGFEISAKLQNSVSLRLDLPDFLPRSIELRRIVIKLPYIDWHSRLFVAALVCLAIALLGVVVARRRQT